MAKEPRRNLESALERLRREDRLRRSSEGSPLYNIAQTLTELNTEEDKVPQVVSLEATLNSIYMVPTSIAFGLLHGLGKIGGNFASLVGALDQEYVDTLSKSVSGKFLKFASEQAPEEDAGGRRLMETIGKLGTAGGEMVSFAVPAIGFARIFQVALGFRPIVATATADALVGFGGMSPDEENFFNFVEEISKENNIEALETLGRILATNPKNTEFENRVNNGIETLIALGLSESVVRGVIKLNTMRKMASAKVKGEDTADKYEVVKEKLSPEVSENLDKAVEPKPTDEEPIGTTVVEAEKPPVDKQTEEVLTDAEKKLAVQEKFNLPTDSNIEKETVDKLMKSIEDGLPIGADDLDFATVVNKPSITPKETEADKYKFLTGEDPSPDIFEPDPKFKKEFDEKAKEIQQQIDDAKIKLEEAKIESTEKTTTPSAPDIPTFKVVGKKPGGSTEGAMIEDVFTGIKYIAKYPKNIEQAAQEAITSRAYQIAGIKTPEVKVMFGKIDGEEKTFLVSEFIEDLKPYNANEVSSEDIGRLHATATVMKDWDTVGLEKDNITLSVNPGGRTILVQNDAGGSMEFRAQGGPKDFEKDPMPQWASFTSGDNKQATEVFRDAYKKDPIGYMRGVENALVNLKSNDMALQEIAEESYLNIATALENPSDFATINKADKLVDTIVERINLLSEGLEEPILINKYLQTKETKDTVIDPNSDDVTKVVFDPVKNKPNKKIQRIIEKQKNVPEVMAEKMGFDPTGGATRFEQDFGTPQRGVVTVTDIPQKDFPEQKLLSDKDKIKPPLSEEVKAVLPDTKTQSIRNKNRIAEDYFNTLPLKDRIKLVEEDDLFKELFEDTKTLAEKSKVYNEILQFPYVKSKPAEISSIREKILSLRMAKKLGKPTNVVSGNTPAGQFDRETVGEINEKLKESNVDKQISQMLDPRGTREYILKSFLGPETGDPTVVGKSYQKDLDAFGRGAGGTYYGPMYNNAFVFDDGVASKNHVLLTKRQLKQAIQKAAQSGTLPAGSIPTQFLTLGKSIDIHVPNGVERIILPQNPDFKELLKTYENVQKSLSANYGKTTNDKLHVVQGYTSLIFHNAYGRQVMKKIEAIVFNPSMNINSTNIYTDDSLKTVEKISGGHVFGEKIKDNTLKIKKGTRYKKFTYGPNNPIGKQQYKDHFGEEWYKETFFDSGKISGWTTSEINGFGINKFLTGLNEGITDPKDAFLSFPVADEVTSTVTSGIDQAVLQTSRLPFATVTLPPIQAKEVVKESSKKVKDIFRVGVPDEFITTIKPIYYSEKNPNKIDKARSALFKKLDLNVLASYVPAPLLLAQLAPPEEKDQEIEIEPLQKFVPLDQGESIREELPQTELDTTPITREATEKSTSSTLEDGTVVLHPTIFKDKETNIPQELSGQDAFVAAMDFEARNPSLEFPRFNTVEEADQYSRDRSEAGGASDMPLYLDTTEDELDIDSQMSDLNLGEQSNDELRQRV